MAWLLVALAIIAEIAATLALRGTADGPRPGHLAVVVVGYAVSFTLLTSALRTLNVGVVYAIWAGVGTAGVAVLAALIYGERLNPVGVAGMVLIITGVVILTLSGSTGHG
jgi:small multidrug resistance pump